MKFNYPSIQNHFAVSLGANAQGCFLLSFVLSVFRRKIYRSISHIKLYSHFLTLLGSLVVFSGCGQHKKEALKKKSRQARQSQLFLQESLARIPDLPDGPFGFEVKKMISDDQNPENVQIFYQALDKETVNCDQIKDSYCSDMELLGWKLASVFEGQDMILVFVRPSGNMCVISLRQGGKLVVALLGKKD